MEGNIGLSLLTQVDWLMYFEEKTAFTDTKTLKLLSWSLIHMQWVE